MSSVWLGRKGGKGRENEVGLRFLFCLCHGFISSVGNLMGYRIFTLAFAFMNFVCLELDLEK